MPRRGIAPAAATAEPTDELSARLDRAEEALRAIRAGEVDALVVSTTEGDRVFTLQGSEEPYRVMLEEMSEGVASLSADGVILYANRRFAEQLGAALPALVGTPFASYLPAGAPEIRNLLDREGGSLDVTLQRVSGGGLDAHVSFARLPASTDAAWCVVIADATGWAERLAAIVESSADAIVRIGAGGLIESWNRAAEGLYGYTSREAVGRDLVALVADDDAAERVRRLEHVLASGEPVRLESRDRRADGSSLEVEVTDSPIRNAAGRVEAVARIARDISSDRRARSEHERLAAIVRASGDAIFSVTPDGLVETWNDGATRLLGYDGAEIVGASAGQLVPSSRGAEKIFDSGAHELRQGIEIELLRRNGTPVAVSISTAPMWSATGELTGISVIARDITTQREAESAIRRSAAVITSIAANTADGLVVTDEDAVVVFANHAAAKMLRLSVEAMTGRLAHSFLHSALDCGAGCALLRALRSGSVRTHEEQFRTGDGATITVEYTSAAVESSDAGGAILVFRDITERKAEEERHTAEQAELAWVGRLRDAFESDRLVLVAQPIVALDTGEVTRHELLLRMVDSTDPHTLIAPGAFLPAAERYGLMDDIDLWVTKEAARVAGAGHPVEFNLSATTLSRPAVTRAILRILAESSTPPGSLVCEVTETAMLLNEYLARSFADELIAAGCQLAIDDFGTGYGGLNYLTSLPVRYVKIDKAFVRDITSDAEHRTIVRAVVQLAAGLGKKTIAEGVEDEATAALLRELGVDEAQGFYFGRPILASEVFGET